LCWLLPSFFLFCALKLYPPKSTYIARSDPVILFSKKLRKNLHYFAPRRDGDVAEKMRRAAWLSNSLLLLQPLGCHRICSALRLTVTAEGPEPFNPKPGQSVVLMLADATGELVHRHYTIRRYDSATKRMEIDVVLHGDSTPGTRWALTAQIGSTLVAYGSRGHIKLYPDADWRLFVGDETCLPAIFSMLEALPALNTLKAACFARYCFEVV